MSDTTMDFRAQMVKALRTQILMGAAEVFSEKGFHRATTKEIARAADVSEGTIYNYFADKRELLVAMMELIGVQSLERVVPDESTNSPEAFLTQLLYNFFELMQERGQFAAPVLAEIFADKALRQTYYDQVIQPIASRIEHYIQRHTCLGRLHRNNVTITTYALLGAMIFNFLFKMVNLDDRYEDMPVDLIIEQIVSLFLDGLGSGDELVWLMG